MVDENFIFIGKKPLMSYVLAALRQINDADKTVVIKARGKAISRAVDVAEILRNQFVTTATVDDIEISTERLTSDEGRESNVSSIEIFMSIPNDDGGVEESGAREESEVPEEVKEKADDGTDFFGEFKDRS
ncbi:MAG: DNA-binding protein Alba [Thermoplasmata archaeon]|nr:DNA-binding protein Alba [Thermoplasmata archaeon]